MTATAPAGARRAAVTGRGAHRAVRRADGASEATLHLSFHDDSVQPPGDEETRRLMEGSLDGLAEEVGNRLQSG